MEKGPMHLRPLNSKSKPKQTKLLLWLRPKMVFTKKKFKIILQPLEHELA